MNDIIYDIWKQSKKKEKLIEDGKLLYCPICNHLIETNKGSLRVHYYDGHKISEVVEGYVKLTLELWNKTGKEDKK